MLGGLLEGLLVLIVLKARAHLKDVMHAGIVCIRRLTRLPRLLAPTRSSHHALLHPLQATEGLVRLLLAEGVEHHMALAERPLLVILLGAAHYAARLRKSGVLQRVEVVAVASGHIREVVRVLIRCR